MIAKQHIWYMAFALIAGATSLLVFALLSGNSPERKLPAQTRQMANWEAAPTARVHLYFSDTENQFLIAEERTLKSPEDPALFARSIVEALIKGPQHGLVRTIPENTALRAIYVTHEAICYVDLTADATENHPGGIKSEILTIYSIVNTLILNIPEIEAVKILINGNEPMTLAGHIDMRLPVKANMLFIR
jgi:spore germination protein GerM